MAETGSSGGEVTCVTNMTHTTLSPCHSLIPDGCKTPNTKVIIGRINGSWRPQAEGLGQRGVTHTAAH